MRKNHAERGEGIEQRHNFYVTEAHRKPEKIEERELNRNRRKIMWGRIYIEEKRRRGRGTKENRGYAERESFIFLISGNHLPLSLSRLTPPFLLSPVNTTNIHLHLPHLRQPVSVVNFLLLSLPAVAVLSLKTSHAGHNLSPLVTVGRPPNTTLITTRSFPPRQDHHRSSSSPSSATQEQI